ncbi:hypothetical protein EDD68_11242 [Melghiribacillus thermohalophilus]|uniref:Uncharacterized protein n=1 Tax=Melghiribacillus thermohalophilus TaxID=1324956 RepID=A0A4R3MX19_9BACI|nr:hypothetical protein [Melghiribacillus thermohalophilus]TCT20914.1 hypothetical protein EDD68_11242 [Melghiribacillus thermohalophilus]
MNDMNEYRARKNGQVTPKMLLELLEKEIEEGNIDALAYVARRKDGYIISGWSNMPHTEIIGLFEVGKKQVIDHMYENE